jgi:hypothetical protein
VDSTRHIEAEATNSYDSVMATTTCQCTPSHASSARKRSNEHTQDSYMERSSPTSYSIFLCFLLLNETGSFG